TIIKIKHTRRNKKDDAKAYSVWAIEMYPLGCDDNEIEVTLFLQVNPNNQNPESQTIFKKDEYYSVGRKIISGSYTGKIKPKVLKCITVLLPNNTLRHYSETYSLKRINN
ncbi:18472_t:CDS:1, partial [Dentiscutata erythropus]